MPPSSSRMRLCKQQICSKTSSKVRRRHPSRHRVPRARGTETAACTPPWWALLLPRTWSKQKPTIIKVSTIYLLKVPCRPCLTKSTHSRCRPVLDHSNHRIYQVQLLNIPRWITALNRKREDRFLLVEFLVSCLSFSRLLRSPVWQAVPSPQVAAWWLRMLAIWRLATICPRPPKR